MRIDKDTREQSEFITKKDGLDFETIVYITNDHRYVYYIKDKNLNRYDVIEKETKEIYADKREKCKLNNAMILVNK